MEKEQKKNISKQKTPKKTKKKFPYSNAEQEARAIAGRSCEDSEASMRTMY